ncbi:MAG TPA: YihY/virulence factor BrkB family protein [Gammaproteobacteria bacterium]|nr:YihY/virulence factor BrkB family protein [Gammaproteobacteria bacterium]
MIDLYKKLKFLLWDDELGRQSAWIRFLQGLIRIIYVVIRDLADGQLTLRAMSLVYTTLLSLVPLLAVSFSVLKGFGVHNQIEPVLLKLLAPLGEQGVEITQRIIEFVSNVKVGVLGSLGLFLLLYTVVSLIKKIEGAFNFTWNVSRVRPFTQRFSDYLSVIFVGPVLVFTAIGITASITSTSLFVGLQSIELFGVFLAFISKAVPFLLIITAFTFIYSLIPNTRVVFKSALVGAVISGILWETTGWAFASFLVKSANYTAIYSAFATLIFFLIWLYLSWVILLIGASIAFYHQNPEYITPEKISLKISNKAKEHLAIKVMMEICERYNNLKDEMTHDELVQATSAPSIILSQILENLESSGYIIHTDDFPALYYPSKPLEKIKVMDVIDDIRQDGNNSHIENRMKVDEPVIIEIFDIIDSSVRKSLSDMNFLQLINKLGKNKEHNNDTEN